MLVLSRKHEESVVVGNPSNFERLLEVKVLEIRGRTVTLGFEAVADLAVHRREVWDKIQHGVRQRLLTAGAPATTA